MMRILYIFGILILVGTGYFFCQNFYSDSSLGDKVFKGIEEGKLYYASTMNGSIFIDMDNVTTTIVTKHLLLSSGIVVTSQSIIDYNKQVFQIPNSIRKYEFIKSSNSSAFYLTNFSLSESDYKSTWKDIYKTYQEFVDQNLKIYSKENSFRYDTLNSQIIYSEKATNETRLKYKVETPTENLLTELIFVEVNGTKKLAAIFTTKN
jgi:hypothetical protein